VILASIIDLLFWNMCKIQGKETCRTRRVQIRGRSKVLFILRGIHESRRVALSLLQQAVKDKIKE